MAAIWKATFEEDMRKKEEGDQESTIEQDQEEKSKTSSLTDRPAPRGSTHASVTAGAITVRTVAVHPLLHGDNNGFETLLSACDDSTMTQTQVFVIGWRGGACLFFVASRCLNALLVKRSI